jgi:MFS family permease
MAIMNRSTPLIKGIITGVVMVITTLVLYYSKLPVESKLHYAVYGIYGAGIIWTLISYSKSSSFTGKFADIFGQGFRCFIVVALIMVAFTAIFSMLHPEFAEESARYYKADLIKEGNKTPSEIDEIVAKAKKQYTTGLVSLTIFGYLITGAFVTAAGSAFLLMRRK